MMFWNRHALSYLGVALVLSSLGISSLALAKKPNNDRGNRPVVPVRTTQPVLFTANQRTMLVNLLTGNSDRNDLLSQPLRLEIAQQVSNLPPGIQKRIARGRGLPPGIAKKVALPTSVYSYLGLPDNAGQLLVIGPNVVLVDSTTNIVLDLILNVF